MVFEDAMYIKWLLCSLIVLDGEEKKSVNFHSMDGAKWISGVLIRFTWRRSI